MSRERAYDGDRVKGGKDFDRGEPGPFKRVSGARKLGRRGMNMYSSLPSFTLCFGGLWMIVRIWSLPRSCLAEGVPWEVYGQRSREHVHVKVTSP